MIVTAVEDCRTILLIIVAAACVTFSLDALLWYIEIASGGSLMEGHNKVRDLLRLQACHFGFGCFRELLVASRAAVATDAQPVSPEGHINLLNLGQGLTHDCLN